VSRPYQAVKIGFYRVSGHDRFRQSKLSPGASESGISLFSASSEAMGHAQ
jgi:hypothetical protein